MIIKGNFPVLLDSSWIGFRPGTTLTHPNHKGGTMITDLEKQQLFAPRVNDAIVRDAANYILANRPVPSSHYGPWGCEVSGSPVPNPPSRSFTLPREGVDNSPWSQKVRDKRIVVSPFKTGQILASYSNGITDLKPPYFTSATTHYEQSCGLFEIEDIGPPHGKYIRDGVRDVSMSSHAVRNQVREVRTGVSPYSVGWSDQIFENMLRHNQTVRDTALITENTADANTGTLDILTAAAEMPKTVLYIMNLCKEFVRLYKDAQLKNLRLSNKIKRISDDASVQNTAQRTKEIKDLTDAIADVWLQFRYAIMPNVYLIEDIIKTNENIGAMFLRYRKFNNVAFELNFDLPPGWSVASSNLTVSHRNMIKRKFYPAKNEWKHLVSTNIFATAWELVPLSFVVDWFLTIGDTLAALLPPPHTYEEGATYSWKLAGNVTFIHKPSNAAVSAEVAVYERVVINPSDYCRLNLNVNLNTYRMYDAFALAWHMISGNLKR